MGATKEGQCGRLRRWLYGMRQAASAWERDYSEQLVAMGFEKGIAAPTVFFWTSKGVRCVVHGDDFTFTGKREDLLTIKSKMEESYELRMRALLGDDSGDDREIAISNRRIRWEGGCLHYEADTRRIRNMFRRF